MEKKIREILKHAGDTNINLSSEFAREQILADIINVIRDNGVFGLTEETLCDIQVKPNATCKTGMPEYYDYEGE